MGGEWGELLCFQPPGLETCLLSVNPLSPKKKKTPEIVSVIDVIFILKGILRRYVPFKNVYIYNF